ncbi:MAG TPA: glycosyltransferase family 9 protein [Candidatus Kapabacteria bacterium]|nr:glycosyltransferase family 9 protein [Candidatus Kapabacteria bacterium]
MRDRKLYSIRFTREALLDREIPQGATLYPGVEYVVLDRQLELMLKRCKEMGAELYETGEEIQCTEWDRSSSLDGKRCLFIALGGIGDALSHTALIAEAKRRYPASEWTVSCSLGHSGNVWLGNPNIWGMSPCDFPIPRDYWESFDYHFIPMGLIAYLRDRDQPNFYDILFQWMFSSEVPAPRMRPEIYLDKLEYMMTWQTLRPDIDWAAMAGSIGFPKGHIVIQINSSKAARNVPMDLWIETIKFLQRRFPQQTIFIFGEGKYAFDFAERLKSESFYWMNVQGRLAFPFYFNFIDMTTGKHRVEHVQLNMRMPGDFGKGETIYAMNYMLTLRGIACIVRGAAFCLCPDSMLVHLAAANGVSVPSVSLYGAFNPKWRTASYPKNIGIYKPVACPVAPCSWHEEGFPPECPDRDNRSYCEVMNAITIGDIMIAVGDVVEG